MYLRINKVPQQWTSSIVIVVVAYISIGLLQLVVCSDDDNYANSNSIKKLQPIIGSGSGSLEKRSSYAVISQAMSQAVENEFGSEYNINKKLSFCIRHTVIIINHRHDHHYH
jgi:hypothetical protein